MNSLNRLNKMGKANCISTFDFSTLYTKIPHEKLLKVMNELTDVCFQGGDREFLSVTKSGQDGLQGPLRMVCYLQNKLLRKLLII